MIITSRTPLLHFWIILGITLILAELITPGLIAIFLGISALIVAFGFWMSWISSLVELITSWMIISLFLIFSLRGLFAKFIPASTEKENIDEDLEAKGKEVLVTKTIKAIDASGRIFFRGTEWSAQSIKDTIPSGKKVILIKRKLSVWIVDNAK